MSGYIIPDDWDGETYQCYKLQWPDSVQWGSLLRGALSGFSFEYVWDEDTGDAVEAAEIGEALINLNTVDNLFPGECEVSQLWAGFIMWSCFLPGFPGQNWQICNGGSLIVDCEYRDLLISTGYPFGQSGSNPLKPLIENRFIMGSGSSIGSTGGEANVTLTINQIPPHPHAPGNGNLHINFESGVAGTVYQTTSNPSNRVLTSANTANAGGGQSHNNLPPYILLVPVVYLGALN